MIRTDASQSHLVLRPLVPVVVPLPLHLRPSRAYEEDFFYLTVHKALSVYITSATSCKYFIIIYRVQKTDKNLFLKIFDFENFEEFLSKNVTKENTYRSTDWKL